MAEVGNEQCSIRFQITDADGNVEAGILAGPGGELRLGVGRQGNRSDVWKVWSGKTKPDVYLTSRTGGDHHLSFHESGEFHHVFASEEAAMQATGSGDRYLDLWHRPESDLHGFANAFSILVPSEDVIEIADDNQTSGKIRWLPIPDAGSAVRINFTFVVPGQGAEDMSGADPIYGFGLSNGQALVISLAYFRLSADERARLDELRHRVTELSRGHETARRAVLWAFEDETEQRVAYDLALYPRIGDSTPRSADAVPVDDLLVTDRVSKSRQN